PGDATLVVFAVTEQDDGSPHGPGMRSIPQFVATGKIQGIVHGRAPAGAQGVHSIGEQFGIVGKVLGNFWSRVETDHERFVVARPDDLVHELDGGFLFEPETVTNRVAGVDQEPNLQRQVCFSAEAANLAGRLVVVHYPEVVLLQVLDIAAVLVGNREHDVDFVYDPFDRGQRG